MVVMLFLNISKSVKVILSSVTDGGATFRRFTNERTIRVPRILHSYKHGRYCWFHDYRKRTSDEKHDRVRQRTYGNVSEAFGEKRQKDAREENQQN